MAMREFDLTGSTPYPVFDFGDNHINHSPSGVMIDGVKWPSRVLDPRRILNSCAPSYITSRYADEDPATLVRFTKPVDISTQPLTSSARHIYGEDRVVMKHEIGKPLPTPPGPIIIKVAAMLLAVPSKKRKGWNLLLESDAEMNLYGDIGGVLCSGGTDTFDAVCADVHRKYRGLLKINTKVGSFVIPDEMGTCFQIFICTGNIYGDVPDNMAMFPLSGMTDIKEIEKFNLPSEDYIRHISPRLRKVLLNTLLHGRFKYLCDNQPDK